MTIPKGICSKCGKGWLGCSCDQYHPSIIIEEPRDEFLLSEEEIKDLLSYFYERAGYISPEFDPGVIELIKRLDEYVINKK